MVKIREEQVGGITVLDEDGEGSVTASGATLTEVSGVIHEPQVSSPGNNSYWIESGSPSLPKFTNSAGVSITLSDDSSDGYSLQESYEKGNSIVTNSSNGIFTVSGTENWNLSSSSGSGVIEADTTLSITSGGNVELSSSTGDVDINVTTGVLTLGYDGGIAFRTNSFATAIHSEGGTEIMYLSDFNNYVRINSTSSDVVFEADVGTDKTIIGTPSGVIFIEADGGADETYFRSPNGDTAFIIDNNSGNNSSIPGYLLGVNGSGSALAYIDPSTIGSGDGYGTLEQVLANGSSTGGNGDDIIVVGGDRIEVQIGSSIDLVSGQSSPIRQGAGLVNTAAIGSYQIDDQWDMWARNDAGVTDYQMLEVRDEGGTPVLSIGGSSLTHGTDVYMENGQTLYFTNSSNIVKTAGAFTLNGGTLTGNGLTSTFQSGGTMTFQSGAHILTDSGGWIEQRIDQANEVATDGSLRVDHLWSLQARDDGNTANTTIFQVADVGDGTVSLTINSGNNLNIGADGYINLNSDGYVSGDFEIAGKLTVAGLIDPTGMVFSEQSSSPYDPSVTGTEGLVWVRDDGYLVFTDQTGTDQILNSNGGSSTLQGAYQNGNTITTDASNGSFEVTGTESMLLTAGDGITIAATSGSGAIIQGGSALILDASSGDVTLSGNTGVDISSSSNSVSLNATSGDANIDGATGVTIDSTSGTIDIGLDNNSEIHVSSTIQTPDSSSGNAVDLTVQGGQALATGQGGDLNLYAGDGSSGSTSGGDLRIRGGNTNSGTGDAGSVYIDGGEGNAGAAGGDVFIRGGSGGDLGTVQSGNIEITGGDGGSGGSATDGGYILVRSGYGVNGNGGDLSLLSGNGNGGNAGGLTIQSGDGQSGDGGTITITSGDGAEFASDIGAGAGGNITIATGEGSLVDGYGGAGDLTIQTGDGQAGGDGGSIVIQTGQGNSGTAGSFTITTGTGDNGHGGDITMTTGNGGNDTIGSGSFSFNTGSGGSGSSGGFSFTSGAGNSGGSGGFEITTGEGNDRGTGGFSFTSGTTGDDGYSTGGFSVVTGNHLGNNRSGSVVFETGTVSALSSGDIDFITGGSTTAESGDINLTTGDVSSGSADCGSVNINLGQCAGSGDSGKMNIWGDGYVDGDFEISGKLTVAGLIDPTGMVFSEQDSAPYDTTSTGTEGLIWVKSDGYGDDSTLNYTDQGGEDAVVDITRAVAILGDNSTGAPDTTYAISARYKKTFSIVATGSISRNIDLPQDIGGINSDRFRGSKVAPPILRVNVKVTSVNDSSSEYIESVSVFCDGGLSSGNGTPGNGYWTSFGDTIIVDDSLVSISSTASGGAPRITIIRTTSDTIRMLVEVDATYLYGED